MITFPFSFVLIPYGLFLAVFLIFALINVYHMVHYGATTFISFLVTFAFMAGSAFILYFTWQLLAGVDWGMPVELGNAFANNGGISGPPGL